MIGVNAARRKYPDADASHWWISGISSRPSFGDQLARQIVADARQMAVQGGGDVRNTLRHSIFLECLLEHLIVRKAPLPESAYEAVWQGICSGVPGTSNIFVAVPVSYIPSPEALNTLARK